VPLKLPSLSAANTTAGVETNAAAMSRARPRLEMCCIE